MLRPIDNLFRDAFLLILRHWLPLLCIQMALMFVTFVFLVIAMLLLFTPIFFKLFTLGYTGHFPTPEVIAKLTQFLTGPFWVFLFIIVVASSLFSAWSFVAMAATVGYEREGSAPIWEVFREGFKRLPGAAVLLVLIAAILCGGFIFFVVPGVIMAIAFSFVWYVYVIQKTGIGEALATSWYLTKGLRWAILGRWILATLTIVLVQIVTQLFAIIPIIGLVAVPVVMVVGIASGPFMMAFGYLMYEDIKRVKGTEIRRPGGGFVAGLVVFALIGITLIAGVCNGLNYLVKNLPVLFLNCLHC